MEYKICPVFVLILSVVSCNQCIEKDLNDLFISNSDLCNERDDWTFRQTSISIDKNDDVNNFLTPSTTSSCITSKTLSMSNGGVLELKIYAKSITKEDYLTIFVYNAEDNNIVGQTDFSKENYNVDDGWHVLKVTLTGNGDYDGYFTLIGKSSSKSAILVESICYSSPHQSATLSEDTSNVLTLPTSSILMYQVHPKENEIDIIDLDVENRSFWIFAREDFWTPLTISLAVIIPVVILALLCWACFAWGKSRGTKDEPQIIYEDVDNLPKPYLVPRVKSVYAESVASSTYGGRNNNIYSV